MSKYEEAMVEAVATVISMEMAAQKPRMTQGKLAAAIGIHRETLSNYLAGKRDIPMSVFVQIAEALGLTARELMERAEARVH